MRAWALHDDAWTSTTPARDCARGAARDDIAASLKPLDAELLAAARLVPDAGQLAELHRLAEGELQAYRARMDPAAWEKSLDAVTDRLLRERFSLPVIDPEDA